MSFSMVYLTQIKIGNTYMQWIGIQLISSPLGLKVQKARVSYAKKKPLLEELKEEDLSSFLDTKDELFIASSLKATDVLFRKLTLPSYEKKKVLSLLPFQIEPLLPYPLEEAIISTHITAKPEQKESEVQLFLSKKENIIAHLDMHEKIGIAIDDLFSIPSALAHFFHFFFKEQEKTLLIHISQETILTVCVEKGLITSSHTFPIQADLPKVPKEWDRIFSILDAKKDLPTKVLFVGDVAPMMPHIAAAMPSSLEILPIPSYGSYNKEALQSFAIPIGLALEALKQKEIPSFSFLPSSLLSSFMQKKKRKKLFSFSFRALCFMTLFLLLSNVYLIQKKSSIIRGFSSFFLEEGKVLSSLEDVENELSKKEIEEKKKQKGYALCSPFASTSQVLSYISTHPAFVGIEDLEILQVNYSLDSYPSISSSQDPYIGKVQIKIFIPKEVLATACYEKFRQDNPLLHKDKKPILEKEGPYYRLTFFLSPLIGELK